MRRLRPGYRQVLFLLLLPLLLPVLGLAPGPQISSDEARQAAFSAPEVNELLSQPTVETSAVYDPTNDYWWVVLREEVSQTAVAELTVVDDTQEVSRVEVFPVA